MCVHVCTCVNLLAWADRRGVHVSMRVYYHYSLLLNHNGQLTRNFIERVSLHAFKCEIVCIYAPAPPPMDALACKHNDLCTTFIVSGPQTQQSLTVTSLFLILSFSATCFFFHLFSSNLLDFFFLQPSFSLYNYFLAVVIVSSLKSLDCDFPAVEMEFRWITRVYLSVQHNGMGRCWHIIQSKLCSF